MPTGRDLITRCKEHILATMRSIPDCQPGKDGTRCGFSRDRTRADFYLELPTQNKWLTHSLLRSMARDGTVEVVPGTESRRKYRLS